VLVVEDDPAGRAALALILSRLGHDVRCAADGEKGRNELRTRRPDVVLLDLVLPKVDGWEFCRRQREDSDLAGVPIVVLSGQAPPPCGDHVPGDVAWLPQPFDLDLLRDAIEHAPAPVEA
jgi:CheY-like chemotaxis protein